jgi:hypothetical protein
MELAAMRSEKLQSMRHGAASAAQVACALAHRRLRDEVLEECKVKGGLVETVVDAEGLDREAAATLETEEALHGAAVAEAVEEALASPAEVVRAA